MDPVKGEHCLFAPLKLSPMLEETLGGVNRYL